MLSKAILLCWACALLITPALGADVSLAWDASISPNIAGYRVYYGYTSRLYTSSIEIGNQTTYTVTNLTNGAYFFAVTAFDINGNESDFSNEVSQAIMNSYVCDINNDGKVNILDMQSLAVEISKADTLPTRDYNGDGRVNALDLRVLANIILGLNHCP